jgi:DNA-binding beta-propeller fold protein YncE
MAYVSSLPITILRADSGEPTAGLNLRPSSDVRGITVGSTFAFLCNKDSTGGNVVLIAVDPNARTFPLPSIALGLESEPRDIAAVPGSQMALMTDDTDDRVAVLDGENGLLMSIPVGADPRGIAITALGSSCRPVATPTGTIPVATPTVTPGGGPCTGDCNGNGTVAINELIVGVNIALGNSPVSACAAFDANGNGAVTINELIAAVNAALNGCPEG